MFSADQWVKSIESFSGKPFDSSTLGDLVNARSKGALSEQAVLLLDAFLMANACGGTPTARPEDIEINPVDGSVFIAFTDATGSGSGSPDKRIFTDSLRKNSRQYGAIYRFEEAPDGNFNWGRFVNAGEISDFGGGFACADNMTFDSRGNLWMVTDIAGSYTNQSVDREDKSAPGQRQFCGIFGNNSLFYIPTRGPSAGSVFPFATGPMECEMTGICFDPSGSQLVISVQHPGEQEGVRGARPASPVSEKRDYLISDLSGDVFKQTREVPLGSNFPNSELGSPIKPCVVAVMPSKTG